MRANKQFLGCPPEFWDHVRVLSERIGYSVDSMIRAPDEAEIRQALARLNLSDKHLLEGSPSLIDLLIAYFAHRASLLNDVEPKLMTAADAQNEFRKLKKALRPKCPLPKNNQGKAAGAYRYLTCMINMLVEKHAAGLPCNYDPQGIASIVRDGRPVHTLSRGMDGVFLGVVNPVALWEVKEYYYTTTFGSAVSRTVYEAAFDGMEIRELNAAHNMEVLHYLFIDAREWWIRGKSYLRRLVDMLHMGLVDEVLVGREVLERLPTLVADWCKLAQKGLR